MSRKVRTTVYIIWTKIICIKGNVFNSTSKFCISISGAKEWVGGSGKNLKQNRSMQDINERTPNLVLLALIVSEIWELKKGTHGQADKAISTWLLMLIKNMGSTTHSSASWFLYCTLVRMFCTLTNYTSNFALLSQIFFAWKTKTIFHCTPFPRTFVSWKQKQFCPARLASSFAACRR